MTDKNTTANTRLPTFVPGEDDILLLLRGDIKQLRQALRAALDGTDNWRRAATGALLATKRD